MNDQSPPKRVTRARAAAKTDTGVKITTAASRAKATRTVSTTKRKTRADDHPLIEEHDEPKSETIEQELPKATRGRAKRPAVVQPHSEPRMEEEAPALAPMRSARGRPKKTAVEVPPSEPARSTRGRAKKTEAELIDVESEVVEEPPKKPTRARSTTISKATAPKKTVKFEEPDKENIVPANAKGKAKTVEVVSGIRAKPVRKPPATTTRATRGRAKVEEKEPKSSPLSPKKATQVATAKEHSSDDELAIMEKTPMKPLMKSPVKIPGSVFHTDKKLDFSNSITVQRAVTQDLGGSIMASPARRPPQSPFKESLKTSPQRANLAGSFLKSPFKLPLPPSKAAESDATSNFKSSLLQSPARRPASPTKVSESGSPSRSDGSKSVVGATPKASTFKISRFATPRTLTKSVIRPGQMLPPSAFKGVSTGSPKNRREASELDELCAPSLKFSGRLSSIMPREADLALLTPETVAEEPEVQAIMGEEQKDDLVSTIQVEKVDEDSMDADRAPPCSPPNNGTGAFALREVDENPFFDSDSEDELASSSPKYSPGPLNLFASSPATPTPFTALNKTPKLVTTERPTSTTRSREQIGYTPLARQLNNWMASSPDKLGKGGSDAETFVLTATDTLQATSVEAPVQPSPAKSTFFEDEMSIRDEMLSAVEASDEIDIDELNFTPIEVVEEDLALAHEADEMSLLETSDIDDIEEAMDRLINGEEPTFDSMQTETAEETIQMPVEICRASEYLQIDIVDDEVDSLLPAQHASREAAEEVQILDVNEIAPSEASQEYGDENAIPIDPILLAQPTPRTPSTPVFQTSRRVLAERVCHTVSKVPLKPAAEDSPMRPSPMKRSASISRLPVQRPSGNLTRSSTVISYSPTKSTRRSRPQPQEEDARMEEAYATPSKSGDAIWSNMGTPARTPRRDLNTALLKGAVVFVDVHTSEGADASALFTELLTQMGARCVKNWNWNPNGEEGNKVGITHVVFKDGGKRTLEKAKETGGVVSCVGVGWVLDCERENKWLSESPYSVDTTMVPRGGHRRRKSMEPRALANLNGTLLPSTSATPVRKSMSPVKGSYSFVETPVTSKSRRRESVQWMKTPTSASSSNDEESFILSPVPSTPDPNTISAYGEEGLYGMDQTPGGQTPYFLHKEQLVQQTAPVNKFGTLGEGIGKGYLSEKKDESVMMRLMAARRKSLQWAPKVGSPLARGGS